MDDWVQVTCEHWKISRQALFLWQSFANGLSPQCSCALSLPLQQTAAKSFDLLHTMRNIFSLTTSTIWPKSRSTKSAVRVEISALETRNACYFTLRPAFPLSDESISVFESQNSRVFILPGRQGACFCRFNRAVV